MRFRVSPLAGIALLLPALVQPADAQTSRLDIVKSRGLLRCATPFRVKRPTPIRKRPLGANGTASLKVDSDPLFRPPNHSAPSRRFAAVKYEIE